MSNRRLEYVSPSGRKVTLSVPWPSNAGVVVPPHLAFYDTSTGAWMTFVYRGVS